MQDNCFSSREEGRTPEWVDSSLLCPPRERPVTRNVLYFYFIDPPALGAPGNNRYFFPFSCRISSAAMPQNIADKCAGPNGGGRGLQ